MSLLPIGPYMRTPAAVEQWDPRSIEVADEVADVIRDRRPDLRVEHIGSTAVPDLPGKGVVDLAIPSSPAATPGIVAVLTALGFGPQPGPDPWPPTRPMLVGSVVRGDTTFRVHCHVLPDEAELRRDLAFRDALRADPALVRDYARLKVGIVDGGLTDGHQYTYQKQAWIADVLRRAGIARTPIAPPATIGILGGGQLGRMLALAARAMGYRVAVLDPDPLCPAASVADRQVVGAYDDVGAALRLGELSDVVTYELEHVAVEVVDALDARLPVRPGRIPLLVTQDRLAERRFVDAAGIEVASWREIRSPAELQAAATALGLPVRLKATTGGYDGRGQMRLATPDDLDRAMDGGLARLRDNPDRPVLVERELRFEAELSVVVARDVDGRMATFPVARNVHEDGVLVESVAPAPVGDDIGARARAIGERLALAMGLTGTLTVELFLMPDGHLVVNELAPRVHNSGHWTLDGAATSQFEQHIRAICGLELGSTDALRPTAMVNLLGLGPRRDARLDAEGIGRTLADPAVHLHLYDKRQVFQGRKMGHLTAVDATVEAALRRVHAARTGVRWIGDPEGQEADR